jgi:hypothetical protein
MESFLPVGCYAFRSRGGTRLGVRCSPGSGVAAIADVSSSSAGGCVCQRELPDCVDRTLHHLMARWVSPKTVGWASLGGRWVGPPTCRRRSIEIERELLRLEPCRIECAQRLADQDAAVVVEEVGDAGRREVLCFHAFLLSLPDSSNVRAIRLDVSACIPRNVVIVVVISSMG